MPADPSGKVIRGGAAFLDGRLQTVDIRTAAGVIVEIGPDLDIDGAEVVDVSGCEVVPGMVDCHTHFADQVVDQHSADDYESGSLAAAFGGITSFVNYAFQQRGERLRETIARERGKAAGKSYLDYGLHMVVTDVTGPDVSADLSELVAQGVTSIKIFTTDDECILNDDEIVFVLKEAKRLGVIVTVHAEDDHIVQLSSAELLAAGHSELSYLPQARPPLAEAVATVRVAAYAQAVGTPVYFVHLSCEQALDAVRTARARGAEVYVETRPAYLFMDQSKYALPAADGVKYVCWPPLRSAADSEALWLGISTGEIDTYATDHTTWTLAEKARHGATFAGAMPGFSNVETALGMLYGLGVGTGRITLEQLVSITSANPSRLFGLAPRKGRIAVGSDADLVALDPARSITVSAERNHSGADYDPYEGYTGRGWPVLTIARGDVVVADGQLRVDRGRGEFLQRSTFRPALS